MTDDSHIYNKYLKKHIDFELFHVQMVTFTPSLSDILKLIETIEFDLVQLFKHLHSGDIPELNSVINNKLHIDRVYNLKCWYMYPSER